MSELIKAMRLNPEFYAEKGASENQIEQAERTLGLKFAPDFKECLREFGAISIGGHELTGFSADSTLDVVEVTLKNRQKNNVEKKLYVIEEAHIDGIVVWQDEEGRIYETAPNSITREIANSLAEYLSLK